MSDAIAPNGRQLALAADAGKSVVKVAWSAPTALAEIEHDLYPVILPGRQEDVIGKAQQRAIQNYRSRLGERGLARFEVLGRDADRDLIRSLARWLAEDMPEAFELRATVTRYIAGEPPGTGGILAALRRSPLVGVDLDLTRPRLEGREVDT